MPDFFKQYRFKDTNNHITDWDQFLNIRIGARIIKDTGEEFQKTNENVFDKVARYYLSNEDIEDKFALLHGTNIFTDPQYITVSPTEPYHIVNKEYIDARVASAAVDLTGFARTDRENIWEHAQTCNSEPYKRTHLTNKGYVDDRINEIEFDTTALARLNSPNTFTAPQSITVDASQPKHIVTKKYVDDVKDSIVNNISGFVRADLPNTFTATQNFTYTITVPEPQTDTEAANKLYVDNKVAEQQATQGNFALLSAPNVFERDQTFKSHLICSSTPSQSYHIVNKEYVDALVSGTTLPDNIAVTDRALVWTEIQNFSEGIIIPEPSESNHGATKNYVDAKFGEIGDASVEQRGVVRLSKPISDSDPMPEGSQSAEQFANDENVPNAKVVASYVRSVIPSNLDDVPFKSHDNEFTGTNDFLHINTQGITSQHTTLSSNVSIDCPVTYAPRIDEGVSVDDMTLSLFEAQSYPDYIPSPGHVEHTIIVNSNNILTPFDKKLSKGDLIWPNFEHHPTYTCGSDVKIGVHDNNIIGISLNPLEAIDPVEDDDGSMLTAQVSNTQYYTGLKITEQAIYNATNVETPINAADGLVTTKLLYTHPFQDKIIRKIKLNDYIETDFENIDEFKQHAVLNCDANGVIKISARVFEKLSHYIEGAVELEIDDNVDNAVVYGDSGLKLLVNSASCNLTIHNCLRANISNYSGTVAAHNSDIIIGTNVDAEITLSNKSHAITSSDNSNLSIIANKHSSIDNKHSCKSIETDDTSFIV